MSNLVAWKHYHQLSLRISILTIAHFDGSARKAERVLAVSRQMVDLGLKERETGIRCQDAHHLKGRKKKKI